MSDAREILERLVRAEWAISDACDASGLLGHSEAEKIAEVQWADALSDACALLGITRPASVFADRDIPMSAENREKVKQNLDGWLVDQMERTGTARCPTCAALVRKTDIKVAA